jgi:hypothetical protein
LNVSDYSQINFYPEGELRERLEQWKAPEPKFKKGALNVYSKIVKSTSKGAGFKYRSGLIFFFFQSAIVSVFFQASQIYFYFFFYPLHPSSLLIY